MRPRAVGFPKINKYRILTKYELVLKLKCYLQELRESLEGQIAELSEKETIVKRLRKQEEKQKIILDELQYISCEREREHARLVAERDACIVNMGLHKYKLKRRVISVMKEIELDLEMLDKLRRAVLLVCYLHFKFYNQFHKNVIPRTTTTGLRTPPHTFLMISNSKAFI